LLIVQNAYGLDIPPDTIFPNLNEPFEIKVGNSLVIPDGILITILNVEDSRCPADVLCVWQGEAKVLINVKKASQYLGNFTLTSTAGQETQSFDGYSIKLVEVQPYPYSSKEIMPSDYAVTLAVSKKSNLLSPLQQFKSGVGIDQIKCKPSYHLVMKKTNGNPVCVKPESVSKLIERGWAINVLLESVQQEKQTDEMPEKLTSGMKNNGSASVQSKLGKPETLETVPASSGSIVNFYVNDDDLNTSHNGIDVIPTTGLLEFTINGIPIQGPQTMTETGTDTGRFFVKLELPDTINGRPLTQDDILEIRYLDQSDAAGEKSSSAKSIPLTKAYAQVQTSGGSQRIGHEFTVRIYEPDFNLDSKDADRIPLSRLEYRGEGGIRTTLTNPAFDANSSFLLETGDNTGIFEVIIKIPRTLDGKTVNIGDWYEIRYIDTSTPSNTDEEIKLKGRIG